MVPVFYNSNDILAVTRDPAKIQIDACWLIPSGK